uniref:Uncharacterized protein n=1 Tax=Aegilops tauschii subsp. strangulata TaxID=200361 RepID=A0A452Y623_AEGTS
NLLCWARTMLTAILASKRMLTCFVFLTSRLLLTNDDVSSRADCEQVLQRGYL